MAVTMMRYEPLLKHPASTSRWQLFL